MAKFIENKDGSRMLVSDDVPDELTENKSNNNWNQLNVLTPVDPVSILICFRNKNSVIPVQADLFVVNDIKLKLAGTMLLNDYAWLLEHLFEEISHLEIRTSDRAHKVANGSFAVTRILGKDLNAVTVNVHLSLKKYI